MGLCGHGDCQGNKALLMSATPGYWEIKTPLLRWSLQACAKEFVQRLLGHVRSWHPGASVSTGFCYPFFITGAYILFSSQSSPKSTHLNNFSTCKIYFAEVTGVQSQPRENTEYGNRGKPLHSATLSDSKGSMGSKRLPPPGTEIVCGIRKA